MAKYIDKENLPQFKHYNFCEGINDNWGTDPEPYAAWHTNDDSVYMTYEGNIKKETIKLARDDYATVAESIDDNNEAGWKEIRDKWTKSVRDKKGEPCELINYILQVLLSMHKDRFMADKWRERLKEQTRMALTEAGSVGDLARYLSMVDEYVTFAMHLRTCQGFPLEMPSGNIFYPKMLLIDADFYKKQRDSKLELDYDIIRSGLNDACYVITVNGESAERKMCFCLYNDRSEVSELEMLDPTNGRSLFLIRQAEDRKASIHAVALKCHPRGDYECVGDAEECVYCNGEHTCKRKTLNIAAAVLYCFQEYIRKTQNAKTISSSKSSTTRPGKKEVETFIPSGMVRLYDIKYSDEELERVNKYAKFGKSRSEYPSTEKAPHVRRGTMRYNPKTGQKDIAVRGSIIHKDKYEGFASAERIRA